MTPRGAELPVDGGLAAGPRVALDVQLEEPVAQPGSKVGCLRIEEFARFVEAVVSGVAKDGGKHSTHPAVQIKGSAGVVNGHSGVGKCNGVCVGHA